MYKKLIALIVFGIIASVSFAQVIPVSASDTSIQISSIGLDAAIVTAPLSPELHTWDVSSLGSNVGYLEYTPWVGSEGNAVLGGHSVGMDGSPSVFYYLDRVKVGDDITIQDSGIAYIYRVTDVMVVNHENIDILDSRGGETLTLLTCQIGSNNGSDFYEQRIVVFAARIG